MYKKKKCILCYLDEALDGYDVCADCFTEEMEAYYQALVLFSDVEPEEEEIEE